MHTKHNDTFPSQCEAFKHVHNKEMLSNHLSRYKPSHYGTPTFDRYHCKVLFLHLPKIHTGRSSTITTSFSLQKTQWGKRLLPSGNAEQPRVLHPVPKDIQFHQALQRIV